jgi:hypothetical protein
VDEDEEGRWGRRVWGGMFNIPGGCAGWQNCLGLRSGKARQGDDDLMRWDEALAEEVSTRGPTPIAQGCILSHMNL